MSPGSTYNQTFPAVADSVPRARTALTEFALQAGADDERLQAIRLAASEAVTNAVLHAYPGGAGTVQVTASYVPDELWVLIGDDGHGLRPGSVRSGLGIGLVLIAQLADSFEIARRSSGGTQLHMRFRLSRAGSSVAARPPESREKSLTPA